MDTRRNVVVIMCDQLRADFLGPYGCDFIPTPNLDALAENGVVFDNAITASTVCAPARMSFLTGRHVSGHDAWTNDVFVKEGVEFLPERMNAAGYMTAAVGQIDHFPYSADFGYKYKCMQCSGHEGCDYTAYMKKKHPDETKIFPSVNFYAKYGEEDCHDNWSCERALEFLDSYTKTGKAPNGASPENEGAPFFMYCGFYMPHDPLIPPERMKGTVDVSKLPPIIINELPDEDVAEVERYRRAYLNSPESLKNPDSMMEKWMDHRRRYAEAIVYIDELVGRIVKKLKDCGIYENTTLVFTADHGSVDNDYSVVTKGPWPYTAQLFIPMIISNHPTLTKGTRSDALCGNLDVGATALDIAGDDKAFGLSRSMIGLAEGSVAEREVNMSEFSDAVKTIVDKRYTFTYYPFTGKTALFDRISDPEFRVNLGGKPEYRDLERKFLMDVTDFMILSKGVRMEAHDVTPTTRAGIEKKHPKFLDNFDIAYPFANKTEVDRIAAAGLDPTANEFCKGREIKAHYGVYFLTDK